MLLILCAAIAFVTALLLNAAYPLQGRLANLLAIACLLFGQIVLLSEALSELQAIGRVGFAVGHLLLFALALGLWWRRGRPSLSAPWRYSRAEVRSALKPHPHLRQFALVVLAIAVLNLGLALIASPRHVTWDPLTYHLPRAYFWWENGTARHYPTEDLRQTEFPPNASFCYMWMMGLSGSSTGLCIPPWLAGLVAAGGTAALARATGHRRSASLFSGLLLLTMPLPIVQMVTEYADLIMAAAGVCFLYFALRSLQRAPAGATPFTHEACYAGLAFGLFLGSKYTAFFLLPAAGLALLGYAVRTCGKRAVGPLLALATACSVGFALFGSYNYVLNTLDFGNPINSESSLNEATSDLARVSSAAELTSFRGNMARYVYQMMDWSWFLSADNPVYRAHLRAVQAVDRALGLRMAAIPEMDWPVLSFRGGLPIKTGFGPIGYGVTLASPLLLGFFCLRYRRSARHWGSALYLAAGWGFLATFTALTAWSIYKTHHFPILICLLLAGAAPWAYARRGPAALGTFALMLPASVMALWVTLIGLMRPWQFSQITQTGRSDLLGAAVKQEHLELLAGNLPPGATVGFNGLRPAVFVFVEHLPQYRYVNLPREDTARALAQGEVAAVIQAPYLEVETDRLWSEGQAELLLGRICAECSPDMPGIPFLDHPFTRCLFVPDANAFLWRNRQRYGYDVLPASAPNALQITGWRTLTSLHKRVDYDFLTVAMPTPGLMALDGDLELRVAYRGKASIADATFNGKPVGIRLERDELVASLPIEMLEAEMPLQFCTVTLGEGTIVRPWQEGEQPADNVFAVRSIHVVEASP